MREFLKNFLYGLGFGFIGSGLWMLVITGLLGYWWALVGYLKGYAFAPHTPSALGSGISGFIYSVLPAPIVGVITFRKQIKVIAGVLVGTCVFWFVVIVFAVSQA